MPSWKDLQKKAREKTVMNFKSRKKTLIPALTAILLSILLIPVKTQRIPAAGEFISYQEGRGTFIYSAVLYKVIVWDEFCFESIFSSSPTPRRGTDVYIFPFNFGEKQWRNRES